MLSYVEKRHDEFLHLLLHPELETISKGEGLAKLINVVKNFSGIYSENFLQHERTHNLVERK